MSIDPKNADIFFQQYSASCFTVGAGIDGVVESTKPGLVQTTIFDPTFDSLKSIEARNRLEIAIMNLPDNRFKYSSFAEKLAQASKVARTIKIHSSISENEEPSKFMDLGFSIKTLSTILRYTHDSLGLNYQSENDFDDLIKTPINKLDYVLENYVTRNFLYHLFTQDFFENQSNLSCLRLQKNGDDVTYLDRSNEVPEFLTSYDDLMDSIADIFEIDDYKIRHKLDDIQECNFSELAKFIYDAYKNI